MKQVQKTVIDSVLEKLAYDRNISVKSIKEAFLPPIGSTFVIGTLVYKIIATRVSPMKIHAVPVAIYEPKKKENLITKAKRLLNPKKV